MTLKEVQKAVRKYLQKQKIRLRDGRNLTCPPLGTIRRWSAEKLIPSPSGGTRDANWPGSSVEEVIATAYLTHKQDWSRYRVKGARALLGPLFERGKKVVGDPRAWPDVGEKETHRGTFEWALLVLKTRCGLPLETPATIVEVYHVPTDTVHYLPRKPAKIKGPGNVLPSAVDRLIPLDWESEKLDLREVKHHLARIWQIS